MTQLLEQALLPATATIRDAMRSLEESRAQIVLIVDHGRRLQGTLTDGDVRRALLSGATLDANVTDHMTADYFSVPAGAARADVLELMSARQVAQVPEIDEENVIVGLHLLHEMLSPVERPNAAVVMAGGRGSRLAPLTEVVPKPMLPVAGRPILERIVLQLVGAGIRRIYLSINYMGEVIEAHFGDGHRFGASIEYLRESEPLGTAGSLGLLGGNGPTATNPFLVMNGDLVTQVSLGRLLDFHEAASHPMTITIRRHIEQLPFGSVEVDDDRLIGFAEKPTRTRLINAGIYVLNPSCLRKIHSGEVLTMPELIARLRAADEVVRVFEIDDDWIDVGRPTDLDRARRGE